MSKSSSSFNKLSQVGKPRNGTAAAPTSEAKSTTSTTSLQEILSSSMTSTHKLAGALTIPLQMLVSNKYQVRQDFNPEALQELADDIKERGVIEPIIVRQNSEGNYEIVAGERRFRAASLAGLREIPAIVKDYDEKEARLTMLVENIQRAELSPVDEKSFFIALSQEYNLSYTEIAKLVHKSKSYINRRINQTEEEVLDELGDDGANNSEKNNNRAKMERLSENSQSPQTSKSGTTVKAASQPSFKLSAFQKFTQTLDATIAMVDQQEERLEVKTREALEQSVKEMESKLMELKNKLKVK